MTRLDRWLASASRSLNVFACAALVAMMLLTFADVVLRLLRLPIPGTYELVPDEMVKHLHKRVMAIALHERKRIPFCGRLVGQAKSGKGSVWLVEDDRGQLIKSQKPMVVEG